MDTVARPSKWDALRVLTMPTRPSDTGKQKCVEKPELVQTCHTAGVAGVPILSLNDQTSRLRDVRQKSAENYTHQHVFFRLMVHPAICSAVGHTGLHYAVDIRV